jgi:hypothetical protein
LHDWSISSPAAGIHRGRPSVVCPDASLDLNYSIAFSDDCFVLSFGNVATFHVSFQTRMIELIAASSEDPVTADHLLYDHVIPRLLATEAPLVLHASLVRMGDRLAAFIGPTGAGKSTLGASLNAAGFALLGDDAVIVTEPDGTFWGEAVYPSLRLYPDSIESVLGADTGTSPMAHYSDKRHVTDFGHAPVSPGPMPLGAIFAVAGGSDAPHARALSVREACMAMIDQSFALDPKDVQASAERMQVAARLASAIPGFALNIPHDYTRLPDVHALIAQCMDKAQAGHPQ